jgi:hypothetical protein
VAYAAPAVHQSTRTVVLACLALALAAPAQAATKVKRFSPWDSDGNPTVKRYQHGSAECFGPSRVNNRGDAWRCKSGNTVLDPCFATPTEDSEVFCITSPFARSGFLLGAVLEGLDHGRSPARSPWAIQVGKRKCTYLLQRKRKGRRATYRCGKTRKGPFLFGRPRTKKKTWTIKSARNSRGRRARRVKIKVAWL